MSTDRFSNPFPEGEPVFLRTPQRNDAGEVVAVEEIAISAANANRFLAGNGWLHYSPGSIEPTAVDSDGIPTVATTGGGGSFGKLLDRDVPDDLRWAVEDDDTQEDDDDE